MDGIIEKLGKYPFPVRLGKRDPQAVERFAESMRIYGNGPSGTGRYILEHVGIVATEDGGLRLVIYENG